MASTNLLRFRRSLCKTYTEYGITYSYNTDGSIIINGRLDDEYTDDYFSIGNFESIKFPFEVRLWGLPTDISTDYIKFGGGGIYASGNNLIIAANKDITVRILIYHGYTFENARVAARLTPAYDQSFLSYKYFSMKLDELVNRTNELWYHYVRNSARAVNDLYTDGAIPSTKSLVFYSHAQYMFGLMIIRASFTVNKGPIIIAFSDWTTEGTEWYDMSPDNTVLETTFSSVTKFRDNDGKIAFRFIPATSTWLEIVSIGNINNVPSTDFSRAYSFSGQPELVIEDIPEP